MSCHVNLIDFIFGKNYYDLELCMPQKSITLKGCKLEHTYI
jgi:hypothetical protein